jgi:hypothetical protein
MLLLLVGMSATQPKNPRQEKTGWTSFYYSKAQPGHCVRVLSPQWTATAQLSKIKSTNKGKRMQGVDTICFGLMNIALSKLPLHPSAEACHIFERAVVESAGYGDTSPSSVSKKGPCTFDKLALCN